MKIRTSILAAAASFAVAVSANAQAIYSINYDSNPSNFSQADISPGTVIRTFTYTPGSNTAGVGGSTAADLNFDSSAIIAPDNYSLSFFTQSNTLQNSATSADLSLFQLDFEIIAQGLTSTTKSLALEVKFNSGSVSGQSSFTVTNDNPFETISLNLGDFSFGSVTTGDINTNIELKFISFNPADTFGRDAGNAIIVDNISLTQIPEPSTYVAIAGLLALGIAAFRRRRA